MYIYIEREKERIILWRVIEINNGCTHGQSSHTTGRLQPRVSHRATKQVVEGESGTEVRSGTLTVILFLDFYTEMML